MLKLLFTLNLCFFLISTALAAENKYLCIVDPESCKQKELQKNERPSPIISSESIGKSFTNVIGMSFVSINAGSFYMGSIKPKEKTEELSASQFLGMSDNDTPKNIKVDSLANNDELPLHHVKITHPFQMGRHEVTLGQFKQFLRAEGVEKAKKKGLLSKNFIKYNKYGDNAPVTVVSWKDAQAFIAWLNKAKKTNDKGRYRLPTEAEWEYAARAGSRKLYGFSNNGQQLKQYAWFNDNSSSQPHLVGQKKPNAWGLFDMQGNVWEWVEDKYDADYYGKSPAKNPKNTTTGDYRVLRGGSWYYDSVHCRVAERHYDRPDPRYDHIGFRVVRVVVAPRT